LPGPLGQKRFFKTLVVRFDSLRTRVRELLSSLPADFVVRVGLTRDVIELRDAYLAAGILDLQSTDDATHVAAATVDRAAAIVSWNFKHIVW